MGNYDHAKTIYDNYEDIKLHIEISKLKQKIEALASIDSDSRDVTYIENKIAILDGHLEKVASKQKNIYSKNILPEFCMQINNICDVLCGNTLNLTFEINAKGNFDWFVGGIVFHKASGFQKFALNLAARIVLSKIGMFKFDQLFIDEGFSMCDEDNISRIPEFLNKLIGLYTSVTIVTHLKELKDFFPNTITIYKTEQGFSKFL
jgi:hypothetical protein